MVSDTSRHAAEMMFQSSLRTGIRGLGSGQGVMRRALREWWVVAREVCRAQSWSRVSMSNMGSSWGAVLISPVFIASPHRRPLTKGAWPGEPRRLGLAGADRNVPLIPHFPGPLPPSQRLPARTILWCGADTGSLPHVDGGRNGGYG